MEKISEYTYFRYAGISIGLHRDDVIYVWVDRHFADKWNVVFADEIFNHITLIFEGTYPPIFDSEIEAMNCVDAFIERMANLMAFK